MKSVDGVYKTCFVSILKINSIAKYKEAARALPEVFLLLFCSAIVSVTPLILLLMPQSWVGKEVWDSKLSKQRKGLKTKDNCKGML